MHKKFLDFNSSKRAAYTAISGVAKPVKTTLGPRGNPVIIQVLGQNPDGSPKSPIITKDGVTVAEHISFREPSLNTIAKAIIQVAQNTVKEGGDGPQPLYSKVLTPTGWISMGDVKEGMEICGTNNSTQEVLGVFPKGTKEIYEVTFSDNRVVECCAEHLWTVTVATNGRPTKTLTTKELLKDFSTQNGEHSRYKYFVQSTSVELLDNIKEMPLDPYLVGLLLGDGSLSDSGSIELSLGFSKESLIDRIKLPEGFKLSVQRVDSKNYYRVKISGLDDKGKTIKDVVESLGLLGRTSKTKFIPKSYLHSSVQNRKALLQGLLDTDGYINARGLFEFSTVSAELSNDFKELVWSLGMSINYRLHSRDLDKDSYSDIPIHRITQLKGYKDGHKIISIKPTNRTTEMQCIKVSNVDHLYITDNFIPTHNTTTAMVLAEAIYKEGFKYVEQGENSIQLYEELKALKNKITDTIDQIKTSANDLDVKNVAKISSNGNEEIAKIVFDAIQAVGEDGYVSLEDGYTKETVLDIVEGAVYKRGWRGFSPQGALLVNDESRNVCELSDAAVLLYAGKLDNLNDFQEFLAKTWGFNETTHTYDALVPLLIIAADFSDDLKNKILQIRVQGKLPIAAIKAPADGSPNSRTEMLEDLACMLGGQVASRGILELSETTDEHLGSAGKIEIGAEETVIFDAHGDKQAVLNRITDLNSLLETTTLDPWDQDNIRIRKGKLSGGIAIVRVGGDSELEMQEKKDRIEDALCAARVSIQDGIVPGGGVTLYQIAKSISTNTLAGKIMRHALEAPIQQIILNSGNSPDAVLTELEYQPDGIDGYDARNEVFVNMLKAGIIDPAKVTKSALENAVSIAGLLLTTGGALIADQEDKDGNSNPFAQMMGLE